MGRPELRCSVLLCLGALLACSPAPLPGADSGHGGAGLTDCNADITVPEGLLSADDPVPATPHEETYGPEPDPFHVHLGLPDSDPSTSVSMLWRTDVDTLASVVEVGPAEGFPEGASRVAGASFLFGGGEVGSGSYRVHEVRLCGLLSPDTTYSYRVGGEGGWSETHTFSTAPSPGTAGSYRVAFAGDSRGAYATWQSLLAAMDAEEPDLIVFSGDMVELGSIQAEWDAWFDASGDVLARRLLLAAHGNHEFLAQHYFAQLGLPGNEEWFAVQYGDLLLLTLNDTVRRSEDLATQAAWLEAQLGASEARWKIANHHRAAYSTCTNHGSNLDVREAWGPAFEAGGVDLVVAGHNHIYERSQPVADGAVQEPGEGVVYVVSGGAGAPLYTGFEPDWYSAVAEPTEHYVIGDFGSSGASFVVKELETGDVIDSFEIPKG